jgi:peptide-methionine (S)-S-oxide reductase
MELTMALNPSKKPGSKMQWLRRVLIAGASIAAAIDFLGASFSSAEEARRIPPPALDEPAAKGNALETAVFAGGCFWGVQGVFQHVTGVSEAVSGYTGGKKEDAHYRVVGTGRTGHAESVRVTFDPNKVSYGRLLQIYFSVAHDPTELNRQGPDKGTQYRSTIFPVTGEQAKIAKAYIVQLGAAHVFPRPIMTTVEPGRTFYPAEDYHQNFLALNPTYPYIVINDLPKVASLKRLYPKSYRETPVLVAVAKPSN